MDDKTTLRLKQMSDLQGDIKDIDKDITLILQSLQWDRKHLLESKKMVTCKYNCNHRIPADARKEHEDKCYLKFQSYDEKDSFLPEPLDVNANTIVKFSAVNIDDIVSRAMKTYPYFKKSSNPEIQREIPLTLSRLQYAFTVDERRALHDAAVAAAPAAPRLEDLQPTGNVVAPSGDDLVQQRAALRDARRRRAKHRRAVHTYMDELRTVIDTQMDLLFEQQQRVKMESDAEFADRKNKTEHSGRRHEGHGDSGRAARGGDDKYYNAMRRDYRDGYREKRKYDNYDREYRDRGERREGRSHDEHDLRQRDYVYVNIKQEKDVEEDGRSRDSRDGHRAKRKYEYDKEYRDRVAPPERERRNHDYHDKYRYYDNGYIKIKKEKDDDCEGRSRERDEHRDRGRDSDRRRREDEERYRRQEERYYRHQYEARKERSGDKYYQCRVKCERDIEQVKIKKEPSWDGYE